MMTSFSPSLDMELTDLDLPAHIEKPAAQQSGQATNVVSLPQAKQKTPQVSGFDYSGVPKAIAKEAEASAKRIRDRLRAHMIDTGKELLNVKQDLGHGRFGKWLEFHFGWKERTAQNYMNSALAFGSTPQVIDILPPSTIYKLAAKSTPEALRHSVIEQINRGESLDPKKIEKRIAEVKTEARHKPNSDESIQSGEVNRLQPALAVARAPENPSTEAAQAEDSGVTIIETPPSNDPSVSHTEKQQLDARVHELRAKRITEHLKKRFGANFEKLRNAILETDFTALKKALSEA